MGAPNKISDPGDPNQNYMPWTETEKGGGFRGGPRRWTGKGPRPARHIPWPEIFKHHLAVLEGHLKMLDMVRKHTIEGSGNHRTVVACLDRTREALGQTKQTARNFVPPAGHPDAVPIGSSSASMYPGYSPADILYGEPAREVGEHWAEARQMGATLDLGLDGPQYEPGQAKGAKRQKKSIAEVRAELQAMGEPAALPRPPSLDGKPANSGRIGNGTAEATQKGANGAEAKATSGATPLFVVDTNPMPVKLPAMAPPVMPERSKKRKRKSEERAEESKLETKRQGPVEVPEGEMRAEIGNDRPKKQKKKAEKLSTDAKKGATEGEELPEQSQAVPAPMEKPKKKQDKRLAQEPQVKDKAEKVGGAENAVEVAEDGRAEKKKMRKTKKSA